MTSPDKKQNVGKLGVAPVIGWSEGLGFVMHEEDRVKILPGCYKRDLGEED